MWPRYLDWPGAAQLCRITRERTIKGKTSVEVVHAITSLPRRRAGAADLLALSRSHWAIESAPQAHTRRRFGMN